MAFSEDFENLPLGMTSSGSSVWSRSGTLAAGGFFSDSARIHTPGDSAVLTSSPFSTLGNPYVTLRFDQICKLSFFDEGAVEVSPDNGITWIRLTGTEYQGTGNFSSIGNRFSAASYYEWNVADNTAIPTNQWWKHEVFDLSSLVGNMQQVRIRFVLRDLFVDGGQSNYGWLVDNIRVEISNHEITAPVIMLTAPVLPDTIYHNGPYEVFAQIVDSSGLSITQLVVSSSNGNDTFPMVSMGSNLYKGSIPSYAYGNAVCYAIVAEDGSPNQNQARFPATGCINLEIIKPITAVPIGTGSVNSHLSPILTDTLGGLNKYSNHISLYTAQEMQNLKGDLVKLALRKSNNIGYLNGNGELTILLKHTMLTSVPAYPSAFQAESVQATKVYENNLVSFPSADGWVEFLFTDTFQYNGADNLMMLISWHYPDTATGNFLQWQNTIQAGKAVTFYGTSANPGNAIGNGLRPNIIFYNTPFTYQRDIGILSVDQPGNININSGITNLVVKMKNYGLQPVTQARIRTILNGAPQPDYLWSGNLQQDIVTFPFTVGSYQLSGGFNTFRVWTALPNDSADLNPANDTVLHSFYHCDQSLSGTYLFGGPSSDFQNLEDLELRLMYCGVTGPVSILFQPGVYYGQLRLDKDIPGLSAINALTLESATGKPEDVIIEYTASSTGEDYIFHVDGADNITIRALTFIAGGSNYARALLLNNGSKHNLIENCRFSFTTPGAGGAIALQMTGNNNSNNTFRNNVIDGARSGVVTNHGSSGFSTGNSYLNNRLINLVFKGFNLNYEDSAMVLYNEIRSATALSSQFTGISLFGGSGGTRINRNVIISKSSMGYGIDIQNTVGGIANPLQIINNSVSITGSYSGTTVAGVYIQNSGLMRVYHNSLRLDAGGITAGTVMISSLASSSPGNIEFIGNIFANFSGGYAFVADNQAISNFLITQSDYNAFYSTGSYLARYGTQYINNFAGIAPINAATQKDSNSVVTNPKFYAPDNLHSFSINLNGAAISLPLVTEDMDGEPRSVTAPDIGADEFHLSSVDAGVISLIDPLPVDTQNRLANIRVIIQNYGTSTISYMPVAFSLNGSAPIPYSWSGTLLPGTADTVVIGSLPIPVLDYQLRIFTQLQGDTIATNDTLVADLFGRPLTDLRVTALLSPEDACNMGAAESVKVQIVNEGVGTAPAGFPVSYRIAGSMLWHTDTIQTPVGPNSSITHTFSSAANMAVTNQDSVFTFIAGVHHPDDPKAVNDTLYKNVLSLSLLPTPLINDTTIPYGGQVQLNAISPFNINWYTNSTTNTPFHTGATYSTPVLFDTTVYYTEANSNIPAMNRFIGTDSTLNAPGAPACVYEGDGATHQLLILASELQAIGMQAGNITALSFYIETTTYNTPHALFTVKMGHTTATSLTTTFITSGLNTVYQSPFTEAVGWNLHNFSIPFYWNGTSNIVIETQIFTDYGNPRLRSTTTPFNSVAYIPGMGSPGVSALRPNIRFATASILGCNGIRKSVTVNVSKPQYDLFMKEVTEPGGSCGLGSTPLTVRIRNNGTDPIPGGYTVSYSISNAPFTTPEVITQNLAAGDSIDYTFSAPASFPSGATGTYHTLRAAVTSTIDAYTPNDTLFISNIYSEYTPLTPVVNTPLTVNYGSSAMLSGVAADSIFWYADAGLNQLIGAGPSVNTGPVYDTSQFYAATIRSIPLTPYTIGTGTATSNATTGPAPFGAPSYQGWGLKNQFLIRGSELAAAGMMKGDLYSIAFHNLTPAGIGHTGFSVKIGVTTQNELNHYESNLTNVFYIAQYQDVSGWNTFNFQAPFFWDGQSNLVVQTCFKNTAWVTSGYSISYYSPTPFVSAMNSYSGSSFQCTDTIIKNIYFARPNMRFTATGFGSCKSEPAIVQVNVSGIPDRDAGVIHIQEPNSFSQITTGSTHAVKVVLKNYGLDTLTTVTIHSSIKGILQAPYQWSGLLPRNGTDTVLIANPMFFGGTTHIKAWTTLPNGQADTIPSNDTSGVTIHICMGGTYTIGSSGADYYDFTEAIADLLLNTVCSPVTFQVDSGLYMGQFIVPRIPGASAQNTVLFTSAQNDSTKVTIQSGGTAADNYVVKFNNASYVTMKHMSFVSTGGGFGNVIAFHDTTHHIGIMNSRLQSSSNTGTGAVAHCVYSNSKLVHHLFIENNLMENGISSAWFQGEFASRIKSIVLNNNIMQSFSSQGVYANYMDSMVVTGNRIYSGSNSTTYYGLNFNNIINSYHISRNDIRLNPIGNGFGLYLSNSSGTNTLNALVDNNFINLVSGNGDQKGIYLLNNSSYINLVYNTVRIGSGSQASFAYSALNGSNQYLKNNIFHADQGYALYITNPTVFSYCDYNNYSVDSINNPLFAYWTSAKSNLAALQQADISKNANSVTMDPIFSSQFDLHVHEPALKGTGSPYPGIIYDIDGDTRHATTPDIGADEFFPSQYDISITAILEPTGGCQLTASENVKIRIRNLGVNTLQFSTHPVTVTVHIAGPVNDTLAQVVTSGSLTTGASMDITLTSTGNLSLPGFYTLSCNLGMASDGYTANNTLAAYVVKSVAAIAIPFTEGFESGLNTTFNETKEINTAISVNGIAASSGSYGLHLEGGGTTGYSYPSTITHAFSQTTHVARVFSCNIDATSLTSLMLRLDMKQTYSQSGFPKSNIFRIMISGPNGTEYLKDSNGDSVFMASTPNLDTFTTRQFSLFPWLGQQFSVSFEAFLYRNYGSGTLLGDNVFIDNINIWSPSVTDVSVREFANFEMPFGKTGTQKQVSVILDNFSSSLLTQVPLAYQINSGPIVRDTFNGSILPLSFTTFTFAIPFTIISGNQSVVVFAELPGDFIQVNDTTKGVFQGINQFQINYTDQFEGNNEWFGTGTNHQWERGTPASTNFTSANSGVNVWATRLTSNYINNSTEYLYTPYFTIPVMPDTADLEFWQQMRVQTSSGWGYLQYSTNGTTWSNLGYTAMPGSTNWYNMNLSGTYVWSQNTSGWIRSSVKMDPSIFNTGNPFQIRFVFRSNTSASTSDGWMIDDFKLTLLNKTVDAGVVAIDNPSGATHASDPTTVTIRVKNFGSDTLLSIPVAYQVNNHMPVSAVWTGFLVPGDTAIYTFTNQFIAPVSDYKLCAFTKIPQDLVSVNDTTCIQVSALPAFTDAGISSILLPGDTAHQPQNVTVRIRNYGLNPVSNIPVSYAVSGMLASTETYTGNLNPGDSADFTFTTTYTFTQGAMHQLCTWTHLTGDMVTSNDTVCKNVYGTIGIEQWTATGFILGQNIPNPATRITTIPVQVHKTGEYTLVITDMIGKVIETRRLTLRAGVESFETDVSGYESGIYFYRLDYNGLSQTRKMVVY